MKNDYKRNDPRGWCGNPSRGAALGRPSIHADIVGGKFFLSQVKLDSQGYDKNGTYFGHGKPLYWCTNGCTDDDEVDYMLRATDRKAAKDEVRRDYPEAKFYR